MLWVMIEGSSVDTPTLTDLVQRARTGEVDAWSQLVDRLHRVVWKTVNMHTRDDEIRKDAFSATWLRLAEHLHRVEDPEYLPGWLATTARREVLTIVRQADRYSLSIAGEHAAWQPTDWAEPDENLLKAELGDVLKRAFGRLSAQCRELLGLLIVQDPPLAYADVSEILGRPIGAIGPTKQRCLDKLRADPDLTRYLQSRRDQ